MTRQGSCFHRPPCADTTAQAQTRKAKHMAFRPPPPPANRNSAPRARFRCPGCDEWFPPQLVLVAPSHAPQPTCQWCRELEEWQLSERVTSN